MRLGTNLKTLFAVSVLLPAVVLSGLVHGEDWKHEVVFPDDDEYCASGVGCYMFNLS